MRGGDLFVKQESRVRWTRARARLVLATLIFVATVAFGASITTDRAYGFVACIPTCLVGCCRISQSPVECPTNCGCVTVQLMITIPYIVAEHAATRAWITKEFEEHRQNFVIGYFFYRHVQQAMRDMAKEITTVAMQQMTAIGAFLDAKQQLETQRLFQQKTAEAHKDYHPDTQMCQIGTAAKSLGAAYRNHEAAVFIMAQRSQDRQMKHGDVNATSGPDTDMRGRIDQFRKRHCFRRDNNDGLASLCATTAGSFGFNKDVDAGRFVFGSRTLDVLLDDNNLTDEERDVFALTNNLFAHAIMKPISSELLEKKQNHSAVLDLRSVIAKRSVAEYSFNSVLAQKVRSGPTQNTGSFARVALTQLGATPQEATTLMGHDNPSYFALMEILTKTMYQNPSFYVGLYDKPANIARKAAALRAIGLMQNMDMLKSQLRQESVLAVLTELGIMNEQEAVQNQLGLLRPEGPGQ